MWRLSGADSGFEIRGGSIISMVVGGSGGMPPQENFDFGPLKMAIWCNLGVTPALLTTYINYIYYVFKILLDTKYK